MIFQPVPPSLLTRLVSLLVAGLLCACGEAGHNTLVFGRGADSVGLDPALENDGESFKVCDNIYETLVTYAPGSTELRPLLAHSWEVSADQRSWTFHLRTGIIFHDGTPFNARAMLFSLGRQYYPDHPYHNVEGTYKYWKDTGLDELVAGMEAPDDSTFIVRLREPSAPFLSNLAMNFAAAVSPAAVRRHGDSFFKNPVGTGPFRFVEWRRDERLILERNDSYWGKAPALDRLIFKPVHEAAVRFLELRQGAIQGLDNVSPEHVDEIREDPELQLLTQPGLNIGYLAMNMDRPPFDDLRVRRAVNHAIDKDALVENLYRGLAVAAAGPVPPTMWGYNDSLKPYSHNRALARELLHQAGFPEGFSTELWAMPMPRPYMPQPGKIAQAIQSDLAAVGIRARIVQWEWGTYLDKVFNGDHAMALLGWTSDSGDPDNILYVLLDKQAAIKPAQNIAFYRSEALHKLLVEARRTMDHDRRVRLYRQAQAIVHQDAPWVPLVHATQTVAFRRHVKGFRLHPTGIKWFGPVHLAR